MISDTGIDNTFVLDDAKLVYYFDVTNMSTTIIIDRYGLVAYKSETVTSDLNSLSNLIENYTNVNYVQNLD